MPDTIRQVDLLLLNGRLARARQLLARLPGTR